MPSADAGRQSDACIPRCCWLLHLLKLARLLSDSAARICPQGELEVTTEAGTGKAAEKKNVEGKLEDAVDRVPFLFLGLDLPAAPLYKDVMEQNIIPQVGSGALCLGFVLVQDGCRNPAVQSLRCSADTE